MLSFLGGTSLSGTVDGGTIRLQIVGANGQVSTAVFARSTADVFKTYTDQLRSKGTGVVLTRKLTDGARRFQQTAHDTEEWISKAQANTQGIPAIKARVKVDKNSRRLSLDAEQSL